MTSLEAKRRSLSYRLYRAARQWQHYPRAYFELLSFFFRNHRDWKFINYGFLSTGGPKLELLPEDENERLPLQLYHVVAAQTDLQDRDVLEVSSGRGGGAWFIARYHHPRTYTALDIAKTAVRFCQKNYQHPALRFVQGDAMALPFPPQSFDAVVNVEASHNYPDRAAFFRQLARVLRPGGFFLYTDVLRHWQYLEAVAALREAGFTIHADVVISPEVLASMQAEEARKLKKIRETVPPMFHRFARFNVGTTDSYPYQKIAEGESTYFKICAQLPPGTHASQ